MVFKHLLAKFYWKAQYLLEVGLPLLTQAWGLQSRFSSISLLGGGG